MSIDTNSIVSATEANQNFSKVAKMAEQKGHVVVFKDNRPKLLVIDLDKEPQIEMTEDELDHVGLSVADGSMKYEELLTWVLDHER